MVSPAIRKNISRIIPFGLIWLFFSTIYTILERGLLGGLDKYPATGNPYRFSSALLITPLTALVAGLLIGTIEILYLNRLFIKRSFSKKIVYKTMIYLAVIVFFLFTLTLISNCIQLKLSVFNPQVLRNTWAFVFTFSFWSVEIYIAAMIGVCLFYTEVSENLGLNVLHNFLTGKYHRPIEEERIFMFLDMKSSTTIAEHIGHVRYFEMLKEYFSDLSDPIVKYSGEIYQYVGDEVVVSWRLKNGLHNNNCIECFFAMKAAMGKERDAYIKKFNFFPEFKAGFHLGKVTTGEIGVLKKEIIFTGDVLNTTARIQGLCNAYDTDLLISGDLLKRLSSDSRRRVNALGDNELRGRDEKVALFTMIPV